MKRSVLLIILPLFALLCRAPAQTYRTGSAHPDLVGTWRLVSYVGEEVPSGVRSDVMGAHPIGYINYGRDGRMIVIIVGSERKRPAGPVATPEEAAALMRSMLAYAGTYTVDQTILITCSATDVLSGLRTSSCPTVASGPAASFVGSTQESNTTLVITATDNAANSRSATTSFTVSVTADQAALLGRLAHLL